MISRNALTSLLTLLLLAATAVSAEPKEPIPPALPTKAQVLWADLEHGQFMHCNHPGDIATMTYPNFDAAKFADCALSQDAHYVVFVAKHGDGFCWWQTQTTDYSIKSAAWKGGHGDVFGEVVAACRARGLKVGFYLSPMDNRFGARVSGIAVDPARQAAYEDYYCTQLRELCTNYGPMTEIWFDGALIPSLRKRVEDVILKLQPDACTFQGPVNTIRWIGNEAGAAPNPAWNAINREAYLAMIAGKGYATCGSGDPRGVFWAPNEADTTLSSDWFGGGVRPLDTLLQCYFNSVGNSAQLLMNVSPRADGSISPDDLHRAKELGDAIRGGVGYPLVSTHGEGKSLTLDLKTPLEFDHVILQEDIAQGERVRKYALEMLADAKSAKWEPIGQGTAIGHKKIHSLSPRVATQIRLTVLDSEGEPQIRKFYVTRSGQTFRDTTPPSIPQHVVATAVDDQQIDVTWSASQDPETGINRYRVLRDGLPAGESTVLHFSDRDVSGAKHYSYRIVAVNGAAMESAASEAASVTTPEDRTPPKIAAIEQSTLKSLRVVFSETVDATAAADRDNYALDGGGAILTVVLAPDHRSALLTTSPLKELAEYTLSVKNVHDLAPAANVIAPGASVRFRCANGLVKYLKLDDGHGQSVADVLGSVHSKILGPAHWRKEDAHVMLAFDGATAIDIGVLPAIEANFTFAAWIRPTGAGEREIVAQDRSGHGDYQFRFNLLADNRLGFTMTNDLGQNFGLGLLESSSAVAPDAWTHAAVTRSGDTFRIYIDGKEVVAATTSHHVTQPYNPAAMLVAARFESDGVTRSQYFHGRMRDFRIYNRALSAAELLDLAKP